MIELSRENNWAFIFNNTIADSCWLRNKSFSPGRWASNYSFLYILYRVLNDVKPQAIIEFGLGQTTRMIVQYGKSFNVNPLTIEHDERWSNYFCQATELSGEGLIVHLDLEERYYKGFKTTAYSGLQDVAENKKYDLIVLDGPFASDRFSRIQILDLIPDHLADSFCIIIDDFDRRGEKDTVKEVKRILAERKINFVCGYYAGTKAQQLICSPDWGFLTGL